MSSRRKHEEGDAAFAQLDPHHPQSSSSEIVQSKSPGNHTTPPAGCSLMPCGCTPLELDVELPVTTKFLHPITDFPTVNEYLQFTPGINLSSFSFLML